MTFVHYKNLLNELTTVKIIRVFTVTDKILVQLEKKRSVRVLFIYYIWEDNLFGFYTI